MTFIFRAGCFCPWRNYTMMNLNKKLGKQTLPIRTMSISSSIGFPIDLVCILPALLNSESLQACKIFEMLLTILLLHLCALFCISNFGRNLFVWAGLASYLPIYLPILAIRGPALPLLGIVNNLLQFCGTFHSASFLTCFAISVF